MNDPENMYDDGTCCAGSLRMKAMEQQEQTWINQVADLETELTRLRAALQSIAALQTEELANHSDYDGGFERGQWVASSLAAKALVTP